MTSPTTSPSLIHRPKEHVTTYTLATATQIAAASPATTLAASRNAFDEAVRTRSALAVTAIRVWAAEFGTAPMDGLPDRHLPDFRCAPGAMARIRPGVADSVLTAAQSAGDFGIPGTLSFMMSGTSNAFRIRFLTQVPGSRESNADTDWIYPETMILEGTTGAWAVWEMLFRIRHLLAESARDRGCLK